MKTIWKYEIETTDEFELQMPQGGCILDLQIQRGVPCIWVEVDPSAEKITKVFRVFGTGHTIPEKERVAYNYCGTYQLTVANLVFHLYEVLEY